MVRALRLQGSGFRLAVAASAIAWVVAQPAAKADLNVGSIVIDDYHGTQPKADTYGAYMLMHFETNRNFGLQDCCKQSDLHWLQLAIPMPHKDGPPIPGHPDRPFIDPENNPKLDIGGGNHPDDLPFYDNTYAKKGDIGDKDKINRGAGPYLIDTPYIPKVGPMNRVVWPAGATYDTVVVCVHGMQMAILGGVEWGFHIDKDEGRPTYTDYVMPPMQLNDSADLEKKFNTALAQDYPGWNVVPRSVLCDGPPTSLTLVPEPSSLEIVLAAGGIVFVPVVLKGVRRRAA
jgi:hypothetical protein